MNLAETLVPLLPLTPTGPMTLKADHPRRSLGAGWDLPYSFTKASFRRTTWQQKLDYAVVLFESLDNFEKWQLWSWARRDYVVILGYNCPSSSRWSYYPHLVRQSKLDNFFTYLSSRRVGRSSYVVTGHITASWGHQHASIYRYFELFQQFMHNHGDVQWLSHGPCIVDSS